MSTTKAAVSYTAKVGMRKPKSRPSYGLMQVHVPRSVAGETYEVFTHLTADQSPYRPVLPTFNA